MELRSFLEELYAGHEHLKPFVVPRERGRILFEFYAEYDFLMKVRREGWDLTNEERQFRTRYYLDHNYEMDANGSSEDWALLE